MELKQREGEAMACLLVISLRRRIPPMDYTSELAATKKYDFLMIFIKILASVTHDDSLLWFCLEETGECHC